MLGPVDFAGMKVGYEQLVAAKGIQRQESVMIIISMEQAVFLLAVDQVIGDVEVEARGGFCSGSLPPTS